MVATAHHNTHAEAPEDKAVKSIEHTLGSNHTDKLSDHAKKEIYSALNDMRSHDKNFDKDLTAVNAKLQHDGYLPGLFIVGNDAKHPANPNDAIGPNGKNGFHLAKNEYEPAKTDPNAKPVEAPPHAAPPPGQDQQTWHAQNPGNPVGSDGGNGNVGGSTPIAGGDVQSNPVAGGALGTPQLRSEIQQALQLLNAQRQAEGLPPIQDNAQNEQAILTIIQHESSGNPNAQNNTDSNAAAGDPSRGLMQTIGTTFSSYHVKGTSNNIFDPVANIAAGVNYAVSRYGSLESVPGVKAVNSGGSYVGY